MKNNSLYVALRFGSLMVLLLAAACSKKSNPEPTKAALLTAHSWKNINNSLTINGYEGTRNLSGADVTIATFSSDGKVTSQSVGSSTITPGTWQLQNNDSQLIVQAGGNPAQTYQLFELTASKLSYGLQYDAATIKQQQQAGTDQLITALLLSAGYFTFPPNTPTIPANQVTSLTFKGNFQQ